jgi:hypothetical protein
MSDDLVKWLRQDAAEWEILDNTEAGTKLRAAADEIERLRAAHDERLWVVRNDIRREAFEEAAKVCERLNGGRIGWAVGAELDEAAAAIRALKETHT